MIADDDVNRNEDQHGDADEDNDFLSVKRVLPVDDESSDEELAAAAGSAAKVIHGLGKEPLVIDSKRREKMLKSKKKLLKLKEKGTKLVFDEDGVAHQMYELEDEDAFRKKGPAEVQRAKFLEEEAARVREADLDDKQLAKQKKREKREKRKAREAAEKAGIDVDEAPELVPAEDEGDPMALLASLPLADGDADSEERPTKRPKKWFEDDSEDEKKKVAKKKRRVIEAEDEPETLEDLEALAAGLLN
jgi:ATP-dependent RNA helicase DDX10/DBP4